MARLEELTKGARVRGVTAEGVVEVVAAQWFGTEALELTFKLADGKVANEILYRDREPTLTVEAAGPAWSFDADGATFRLAAEARRIRLGFLFDPFLAVQTSLVEPLPHQITAVYQEMIPRQPLRFLLADDPGAGKTIMAGLLIKELITRGDLHRCLIVSPGVLVEQWQDELLRKFDLRFDIISNDTLEGAATGNAFAEHPFSIARLDKLARNDDVQAKAAAVDWDLVVVDEAHKMSASFFGGEAKYTQRYRLGQVLSAAARHFLLMTATPHNGKEEDFQLFLALLDGDRFEGRARDGAHTADTSDLMRRLVKEDLLTFEGKPLFPERRAYTVNYTLSPAEAALYSDVTTYVREEFDRAKKLENEKRKGNVGFALMALQRRLASSPAAIHESLQRRRKRLEDRLREEELVKRGQDVWLNEALGGAPVEADQLDEFEEFGGAEAETVEEQIVDQATAASTIGELKAELSILRRLEEQALRLRNSRSDRKWDELSKLLQDTPEMTTPEGSRRKLVVFTEHRDTLNYLVERIRSLIGRAEAVVQIHGGMGREERTKAQEAFTQDKETLILVATDAAGEGINLQRAHLMVNYDLPWNPNRLEQRFGRIHRIGQTEVCHLWNMVAKETREGAVYLRLLEKLEEERKALGGKVFDVLGRLTFDDQSLRDLLREAVLYGDRPETRARLSEIVDRVPDSIRRLVEDRALVTDTMDFAAVSTIREDMERAAALKLQPHHVSTFFRTAFARLGGAMHERESGRYEITHVPAAVRHRDRIVGAGEPVLPRYERVTFEKKLMNVAGKPTAKFVCPGHPLLDAVLDLTLEALGESMKRGALLVDPLDDGAEPRALFFLEHAVYDGRTTADGRRREISKRFLFVEVDAHGAVRNGGSAPYLDYEPLDAADRARLEAVIGDAWLKRDLENEVKGYALREIVPQHLVEVKRRREEAVDKTLAAVKERLTKAITYWDHREQQLLEAEAAGRAQKMNAAKAHARAEDLRARLQKRLADLKLERQVAPAPPTVVGGALVVPAGLLRRLRGETRPTDAVDQAARDRVEALAMAAVMAAERALGFEPKVVSAEKLGYDIESRVPRTREDGARPPLRFIEVKGRAKGSATVTITRNEILCGLNRPESFLLAIVEVEGEVAAPPVYVRKPFGREPDFGVTSVNYGLAELFRRAEGTA